MSSKLTFRRARNGLFPSDDVTMEWLSQVPENVDIVGTLRVPRNAKNHRHMFAILKEACDNIDGFGTIEDLIEYLKYETGMYKVRSLHRRRKDDGRVEMTTVITYESISFESMDEVRFKRVKNRWLWVLHEKFGFEPSELEERAMNQLAAYGAPSSRRQKSARPEDAEREASRIYSDAAMSRDR